MATDLQTEEFLEHHGVKGMRWGVRKNPAQRARNKNLKKARKVKRYGDRKKGLTPAQKKARAQRRVDRTNIGIGAAGGAVYAVSKGYLFLTSPRGLALVRKSGNAWRKSKHLVNPTVEDKIKKYIRDGPPPSSFIDADLANKIVPWKP